MTQREINRLAAGSKTYVFEGTVLIITDYYNRRNSIKIDLTKLTPEMLEDLQPDEDED